MNSLKIKGNWQGSKDKLKQQFANLNDLLSQKDKTEELLGRLKNHIEKADEDLKIIISKL
jgi:uncharacterized protein YjbJ (UPF0337 family)